MNLKSPISNYALVCLLWVAVSVFCWYYKQSHNRYNNYLIFTGVYHHTVEQKNLYAAYPLEYDDVNHYGPLFSLVIAPFALLPEPLGLFFWNLANAIILIWSISLLPISRRKQWMLLLLCTIEFANATHTIQFNQIITAFIILAFVLVERKKEGWATLMIVLGTLIKLYPIIGLAFFVFSTNKRQFIVYTLVWLVILLTLPMLISSKQFIVQSYVDWYNSLKEKNSVNVMLGTSQDWSVMGTARSLMHDATISNTPFILIGTALFGLPLLRFRQYQHVNFRLNILASSLLFVVLFSTGSEHPTYIIAVAGAFLWLLLKPKPFSRYDIFLVVLLLVLTGLGPTDLFPKQIRENYIVYYAMKAWPCIVVWLTLCYDLCVLDFTIDSSELQEYKSTRRSLAPTMNPQLPDTAA